MGGTFDPIHHGHLVAASEVADLFDLDEVVFVPTGQPWQKRSRAVTPAEDRYLMTVIATASNPQFSVSRVDIDRGGPTYTKDTLRDLHAQNPTRICTSSPAPTPWRRSCRGRTGRRCSRSPGSSGSAGPATNWTVSTSPQRWPSFLRCAASGGGARPRDLVHRLPAARRTVPPHLVPGSRRRRAVRRQTRPLSRPGPRS